MNRRIVPAVLTAAVGLSALVLVAPAQPPKEGQADGPKSSGDLRKPQEQNAKLFRDLAQGLLRLAQKLERSDKPEDQERAKTIRAALKVAEEAGVENQFQELIAGMSKGSVRVGDLHQMIGRDKELAETLQMIVNILMTDDETTRIKAEIARLTAFLKEVKDLKRREEIIRAMTEAQQKADASRIAKSQGDLARQTQDLAKRMGGQAKDADRQEARAESKGEGKPGETNAEPKPDTREAKSTEKAGDPNGEANEPKPAEPKADDRESDAREGSPENAGAEARGKGDPKSGDPKSGDPKSGDAKSGDPKSGDPKSGDPKAGDPKSGDPKAGDPKSGDPKSGDPKAGDPKAGDPKAGEPKADQQKSSSQADPKGKGEGKAESKPSPAGQQAQARGMGEPKGGQQQQQAQNKGGGPSQNQNQQARQNQNQTPGRRQVEEAYPHQRRAEDDLNKQDRKNASKNETKAIEELSKAIEDLEKRLKQLREEEMLKTLAALEARCNRMLAMQIEVYENTKAIHAGIQKNADKKPEKADIQKSQQQASKEQEIVIEADKTLQLLASEGSAVAFATVLDEVKGDMVSVQRRLEATYVDIDTQAIEENIIAMLKDMIQALKRAQQDLQNQQQQNQQQNNSNNRQNQRLIDLLAELRLIRAMQVQVNQRTTLYGKRYPGEQTGDPIIQTELRQLSQRQVKLQDMIHKIATQANQ